MARALCGSEAVTPAGQNHVSGSPFCRVEIEGGRTSIPRRARVLGQKRLPRSTRNRPWVTSQQHPEKCRARISTATRAALAAESVLPEKPSSPSSHVGLPPDVCLLLARHAGQ